MQHEEVQQKSNAALREEAILAFWKDQNIFQKSIGKNAEGKEFVFYEGPPTANAKPALHHLEARAFKDVIPRYKTMQGYHVARRAGWDTHGLPVELQIEKALGLQSKKDIERYGVAAFNKACKDSVFTYIKDWETFTDRIGYWVDKKSAYYTFDAPYMESLWHIVSEVDKKGLLYKDYKVVPWCPRCGTGLSSHELAQGYMDVKDLSVTAKFKIKNNAVLRFYRDGYIEDDPGGKFSLANEKRPVYILAWTTTPWTLPGNVGLAIGKNIGYIYATKDDQELVLVSYDFFKKLQVEDSSWKEVYRTRGDILLQDIIEYEPLYPFLSEIITGPEKEKMPNAYKVYAADFVTTTDGTGIVHTAVMYGADDFVLGTAVNLPKFHTVDEAGHFIQGTGFLEGRFVKDEEVAIDIIKDLAHRGLLFKKEKYEHSYPHCWRCKTPLLYYARDSWYIRMSALREELLKANDTINWEPAHIKEGRFGEWLREVKDWAFSRERYWGTPLPVWVAEDGEKLVVDSIATLKSLSKRSGNTYFVMRHGQTEHNLKGLWNYGNQDGDPLTDEGKVQVQKSAGLLQDKKIDLIIASPFLRTLETARMVASELGLSESAIVTDDHLAEWKVGAQYDGKPLDDFFTVRNSSTDRYNFKTEDGESYIEVLQRAGEFLYDIETKYQGKNILIVSHGAVTRALELIARGITFNTLFATTREYQNFDNAEVRKIDFVPLPHNEQFEIDLHKPYIDEIVLVKNSPAGEGKQYTRVKEVVDVWFDSGAMPFAQEHYMGEGTLSYPADFISEAIDQTRGWFYTLLAVGTLMGRGTPYKNVICLGHLLDKDGKKMSKSIGNIVEPFEQMDTFGVDAVRWWMYSVNAPGENKNYDPKAVAEINNKVFNLFNNVLSFYGLYRDKDLEVQPLQKSENVLDSWIMARLSQTISEVTASLDAYDLFKPTRAIREFIDDLSTWYLRRSRDRIKDGDKEAKQTLYHVLKTTAQIMAPFAPFFSEYVWQKLKTPSQEESVHLSVWSTSTNIDLEAINNMQIVRNFCTAGNAFRKTKNLPIRQPLKLMKISYDGLSKELTSLIEEELNIKMVVVDLEIQPAGEIYVDEEITPELKLEGEYRELVRTIQDMRKEKGLTPQDTITLTLPEKYEDIVSSFGDDLKKTVGAKEVIVQGEEVILG